MSEAFAKTGQQGVFALTYGATLPFTIEVFDFDGDLQADIRDWTCGTGNRRLGTTDLTLGTLTVLGYMTVASTVALASTVWSQTTTATGNDITCQFSSGSGNNAGGAGSGKPWVLKGVIARSRIKASKIDGIVACMIQFQLCGSPT